MMAGRGENLFSFLPIVLFSTSMASVLPHRVSQLKNRSTSRSMYFHITCKIEVLTVGLF